MIAKARPINGTLHKRWVNLWGQALEEGDPQKLTDMLAKIDRMLQERQDRLNGCIAAKQYHRTYQLKET
jgi:hypothetical protein